MAAKVITPVPTLSDQGWVRSIPGKVDFIMSHFFTTDVVRSSTYANSVISIQNMIMRNTNNMQGLATEVRNGLENCLRRYFESASVRVDVVEDTSGSTAQRMRINAEIADNGETYSVGKLIELLDAKFKFIVENNNEG